MGEFFTTIPQLIWLMLPAGIANMSPVLVQNHLNWLAVPVDAGRRIGGKPVFGSHKTWRGLLVATIVGGIFFLAQVGLTYSAPTLIGWSYADLRSLPLWFGFAIGAGAILGDLIKSFFKRRVAVAPGKSWFPFDQLDYVVGAAVAASFFIDFSLIAWVVIVTIGPVLHIIVNHLAFWLGIRDEAW